MLETFTRRAKTSALLRPGRRRSRRAAIEVAPLESRSLLSTVSPITITEGVNPKMVGEARGRPIAVSVSGTVADSDTSAVLNRSIAYTVFDNQKDRQVGSGTATIASNGSYGFNVRLPERHAGRHASGTEEFTISVMANDSDGNSNSDSAVVTVTPEAGRGFSGRHFGRRGSSSSGHGGAPQRAARPRIDSISGARGRTSRIASPFPAAMTPSPSTS